ncbi:MAG: ribose-phosphate pyrophosphokinase [Bacteroidales bacterium]|nr:ribose-phosphate pyrophosphokinase [Bacteroidales bacterium]
MAKTKVNIFSGRASRYLAEKIAKIYGQELGKINFITFSDGEFSVSFEETVRGNDIFIVQSTFAPSENLFELLMMADAAKRASAKRIVAVIPYYGFARQDRKDKPRVAIGAKLVADLLSAAGVNRIITMDLHSDQIQGFFDFPVDHLYASTLFVPYLKKMNLPNLTMASPDTGGAKRAAAYAKFLNSDLVICFKQRAKANQVEKMTIIGEVEGKDIVLVDDIIDTAGTICKAAELMMEQGASSVRAMATHPVFSGPALDRIHNSVLSEVIVTDTFPVQETEKIKIISSAPLFADVIDRVHRFKSISSHFDFSTIL